MKAIRLLTAVAALLALNGCGEKKQAAEEQVVRVKVQEVHAEAVHGEQGFSGTIEESSGVALSFIVNGTIQRIFVDAGQTVSKGQTIAELDPTSLQNAYAIAKTTLEQAEDTYKRMKALYESESLPEMQWVMAENQLKSAKAHEAIARKALSDTRLCAPFSGFISAKMAEVGQAAAPGMPVVTLVSISTVKVKIAVPEDDVQRIQKGSVMRVVVPALGGREFTGRVSERGVSADPRSRTYEVKATFDNAEGVLLPGMICQAFTNYMIGATGIFVPAKLMQLDSDNRRFVWVVQGDKAVKRTVTIQRAMAQGVLIGEGLAEGDLLIVAGQQKVSNGMKVEIVK